MSTPLRCLIPGVLNLLYALLFLLLGVALVIVPRASRWCLTEAAMGVQGAGWLHYGIHMLNNRRSKNR